MSKVALIIIYNHQYNKNIDILEQIYKDKFSNIYHIVPFYNGEKSNVIPVYESSYYFQGYVSQGYKSYFKEEYTHYFFVADDLILNPIINENNYAEHLNLNINASFIPNFVPLHDVKGWWAIIGLGFHWSLKVKGVEAENQLPSYEKALQKFQQFGLTIKPLRFNQIWKTPITIKDFARMIVKDSFYYLRYLISKVTMKRYILSYPIVGSYSDIFVVDSDTIKQFCHYCGVFAATKLFVEVALPTSMVLTSNEIVTENDLKLKGKALWTEEQLQELNKYEGSLKKLLQEFPANNLYLHPIKLSKWNNQL